MASRAFATAIRTATRATVSRPSVAIRPMSLLANSVRRAAVKSTVSILHDFFLRVRNSLNFN
jgi:hypothetical protein